MKRTVYLGQYSDEVANEIAGELEEAGIGWFYKQAGPFTRSLCVGEWGTRMFVDAAKLPEAKVIAVRVIQSHERS